MDVKETKTIYTISSDNIMTPLELTNELFIMYENGKKKELIKYFKKTMSDDKFNWNSSCVLKNDDKKLIFNVNSIDDIFYRFLIMSPNFSNFESMDIFTDFSGYQYDDLCTFRKTVKSIVSYVNTIISQSNYIFMYKKFFHNMNENLDIILEKRIEMQHNKPFLFDSKILKASNKILFIVGYVPISDHGAHVRLLTSVAISYAKYNSKTRVEIIITGENSLNYNEFMGIFGLYSQNMDIKYHQRFFNYISNGADSALLNKNLSVKIFRNTGLPIIKSYIDSIKPEFIFFWSGSTGSDLLRKMCHGQHAVGLLFFNNRDKYDSKYDLVILRNKEQKKVIENTYFLSFPKSQNFNIFQSNKSFTENSLKLKKDQITILTVLAGNRIPNIISSYSSRELDLFFNFLYSNKRIHYIFIGSENSEALEKIDIRFKLAMDEKKVSLINKVNNLVDYYKYSDLMLHLPRFIGGGGGVSLARENNLPVLCFNSSDAGTLQKEEYLFFENKVSDFFNCAKRMVSDESLRKKVAQELKTYQNSFTREQFAIELCELILVTKEKMINVNKAKLPNK